MEYTGTTLPLATNCGIYRWRRPTNPDTFNLHTLPQLCVYLQCHDGAAAHDLTHTPDASSVARSETIKTINHCNQRDKQEAAIQLACCERAVCTLEHYT